MGRKKHSSKMHHMGSTWAKHASHKHRKECERIWNSLRERRWKIAQTLYTTVSDLMRMERR